MRTREFVIELKKAVKKLTSEGALEYNSKVDWIRVGIKDSPDRSRFCPIALLVYSRDRNLKNAHRYHANPLLFPDLNERQVNQIINASDRSPTSAGIPE